jgi:hypothetical protein
MLLNMSTPQELEAAREYLRQKRGVSSESQVTTDAPGSATDADAARAYLQAKRSRQPQIPEAPQEDGFLETLGKGILRTPARAAVNAYNLGETAVNVLGGQGLKKAAEDVAKPRNLPFLGETAPITTPKESIGAGLELGSYAIPGSILAKGGKLGATLGQSALRAGGAQAIGGATGSLGYGLGQEMGFKDLLTTTAAGATLGAGIGASIPAIGAAAGKVVKDILPSVSQKVRSVVRPDAEEAVNTLKKTLNIGKKEYNIFNTEKELDKVIETIGNERIPIYLTEDKTKWLTQDNSIPIAQQRLTDIEKSLQDVLDVYKGAEWESLIDARDAILKQISSQRKGASLLRDQRLLAVKQMMDAEIATYGNNVDLPTFNQIKRNLYDIGYKDDMSGQKMLAAREASRYMKEAIERRVDDPIVKRLNQRSSDIFDSIRLLESLNGKVVSGGKIGKYTDKTIGAIAGSYFGPFGSIAGALVADALTNLAKNPEKITNNSLKVFQRNGLIPESVKTINQAKEWVRREAVIRGTRLRLPQNVSPSVIPLPAPGVIQGQSNIAPGRFVPPAQVIEGEVLNTPKKMPLQSVKRPPSAFKSGAVRETAGEFDDKLLTQLDELRAKTPKTPQDISRIKELEEMEKNILGAPDNPIGSAFPDYEVEKNFGNFNSLLKDARLRSPSVRENILSGDIEAFENALEAKKIMTKEEIRRLFYSQDRTDDEMFNMFRERFLKEAAPKNITIRRPQKNRSWSVDDIAF